MSATMPVDSCIAFANALLEPAAVTDARGRLLTVNPSLRDLLGGPPTKNEQALPLVDLVPRHRRDEVAFHLQSSLQGERIVGVPSELRHRNGHRIPVRLTLSPLPAECAAEAEVLWSFEKTAGDRDLERLNRMLEEQARSRQRILDQTVGALAAEIDERRKVEDQLRHSQKRLRLLSRQSLELLESDRQTVAKELHDSIGASLAAIKFSLEGWLDVYGNRLPSPEIPFESIIAHIVETIKETKRISANLRPTTLDDLGLLATAQWFCRNLVELYQGIRITPHFGISEADIPDALKIVLYRVMQEALSNAAKHSGAEEIRVELDLKDGQLEMTIADGGCGFDPVRVAEADSSLGGFGINSMRERVEICNGHFELDTRMGEGTRIRVRLPVAAHSKEVKNTR